MNRMWMRRAAVTCVCVCVRVCECVWHLACYEWCWWVCVCMCVYMCMCMCACVCVRVRLFGILHVINTRTCHDAFCLFSWHLGFFFRGGVIAVVAILAGTWLFLHMREKRRVAIYEGLQKRCACVWQDSFICDTIYSSVKGPMGWLRLVGSLNHMSLLQNIVSFIGLFCKREL